MVYLAVPIGRTSLKALELEPLDWPRNGVGLRRALELAVAAISTADVNLKLLVLEFS